VIEDRTNGLLVDFFSPEQIAEQVTEILDYPDRFSSIRHHARETILNHYNLRMILPQHIQWVQQRVRSFATTCRERLTSPISQTKGNSKLMSFTSL
jgi:hypothetical protein